MNNNFLSNQLLNRMLKDRDVRVEITKDSFLYFFHFYYAHYIKYQTADFQKEIIHLLEKSEVENLYLMAFRGSGKSTMVTTAYPIWAILGKQQKKFVTIFCQTRIQAKQHMMNIRTELENNDLLKRDLGPFREEADEWGSYSLVFNKSGARITVASTEQSIRGMRHNEHRPDLIICDDVEDVQSTKTKESRAKIYAWLYSEVIPAGDKNTRLIIVGNLLHEDSLLMKIKEDLENGRVKGSFKEYPLIKDDICLWPGKYPTSEDIENEKLKVASEISWQREYLLRIIPSDEQVIYPEWLHFYEQLPDITHKAFRGVYMGVDLAISSKDSADYTAVVMAYVYGRQDKMRICILPNPVEERLNFPDQIDLLKSLKNIHKNKRGVDIFVESVAYQEALPQVLRSEGVDAEAVKPKGDKRTRLSLTSTVIKSGRIYFPKQGCEKLIQQLVHFGVEKHDDLADAFSLLVNATFDKHSKESTWLIMHLGSRRDDDTLYYSDYLDVEPILKTVPIKEEDEGDY